MTEPATKSGSDARAPAVLDPEIINAKEPFRL
jgi:hypothetical protein